MPFAHLVRHLTSPSYRKGRELAEAIRKVLENQRDQLRPEAIAALESGLQKARAVFKTGSKEEILAEMDELNRAADKYLLRFPHAAVRDYLIMAL